MSIGTAGATMRQTSFSVGPTVDHGDRQFFPDNHRIDDRRLSNDSYEIDAAANTGDVANHLGLGGRMDGRRLNCRLGSSQRRSDVLAATAGRSHHSTTRATLREAGFARASITITNNNKSTDNSINHFNSQSPDRVQSDLLDSETATEALHRTNNHRRDISSVSSVNRGTRETGQNSIETEPTGFQEGHNHRENTANSNCSADAASARENNRHVLLQSTEKATISSSVKTNTSQLSTLSGRTMGFNNTTAASSAWNTAGNTVEKMEASTLQTEQSREDEDDNTTIRSFDSLMLDALPSPHLPPQVMGTPSTISTAPSTDDASFHFHQQQQQQHLNHHQHRRIDSWDGVPPYSLDEGLAPNYAAQTSQPQGAWSVPRPQQHVASFRTEGTPPIAPRWQHQHHPLPFVPREASTGNSSNRTGLYMTGGGTTYESRRGPPPLHPTSSTTPPRSHAPRPIPQTPPSAPSSSASNANVNTSPHRYATTGSRSSSEVLKTLLRKKACLYEPDTSRAVTLITWLVGRILALEYGFFSRQQLQAGVHACVSLKIDSGVITRTKVNRCMQIILNSCFHYIIPRPDGTEENGDMFREVFATQVSNDDFLLRHLPSPWNDMSVDRDDVLSASTSPHGSPTHTPQASPQLTSMNAPVSPSQRESDDKRAVLLCFNENVRSALDVFRCHNEFIHDTAHASHLQLSSHEWRQFFGSDTGDSDYIWGDVGVPLTHLDGQEQRIDSLGVLSNQEAAAFRTTWCSKRYDHHHELCGFAHAEVNGGWLRRNPAVFEYSDEMCPHVHKLQKDSKVLVLHECPNGIRCPKAHSLEEHLYHPNQYKARICQHRQCSFGDVCPNFHPVESHRVKKSDVRGRHARAPPVASSKPAGAPILYTSPAPMSAFDMDIKTPGLQNLYRRHCAVTRALLRQQNPAFYHLFDTNDISSDKSDSTEQQRDHWSHFKAE